MAMILLLQLVVVLAFMVSLASVGLTLCSERILHALDCKDKYRGKLALRYMYNSNLQLQSVLLCLYNTLAGNKLHGVYGGKVDYMMIYPIKSVSSGVKVTQWELRHYGFKGDRQYMLAHWDSKKEKYEKIGLNECPKLASVEVEWCEKTQMFEFTYGSSGSFELPIEITDQFLKEYSSAPEISEKIDVWKVPIGTHLLDKLLPASFIEEMGLAKDTVLVCSAGGKPCKIGVRGTQQKETLFQDYYPVLMVGEESFEWMEAKCGENAPHHTMSSWRPNLIITDTAQPFAEDHYSVFDIITHDDGEKRHRCDSPIKCIRCNLPNLDYDKGEIDKKHFITKMLAKHRRVDEAYPFSTCFGKYVVNLDENYVVTRGDTIDVILKQCTFWTENPFS